MKLNNKFSKLFFSALMLSSVVLTACEVEKPATELYLDAPVVEVSDDGVVTWNRVNYAETYKVSVNDIVAFTTDGYSYEIKTQVLGSYNVYVVAYDNDGIYKPSVKSNIVIYNISQTKLNTPIPEFDGDNITWPAIAHASGYTVYLDGEVLENPNIITSSGVCTLNLENVSKKKSVVEVKAITNESGYKNSDISSSVIYLKKDKSGVWDATAIDNNFDKENSVCIQHIIEPEILVWVDTQGTSPAVFENYVEIPSGSKAFAVTGLKDSSFGACLLTLEMKSFDGEYETINYQTSVSVKPEDLTQTTYYWELPAKYQSGSAFVRITMESSGAFQARFILRYFSFEANTSYTEPVLPINKAITIMSVSNKKYLKYNSNKGFLTLANNNETASEVALKLVPDTVHGNGYYRLLTQDGLYLSVLRGLREEDNAVVDHTVATQYNANLDSQVWMFKALGAVGGIGTYTIYNYGMPAGSDLYYCLNCDSTYEAVGFWSDIEHANLQYIIKETTATFAGDGNYKMSSSLDLSKPVITYFTGYNKVFTLDASDRYILGENVNTCASLSTYAWKFELISGNDYYIKTASGKYVKAVKDGATYHLTVDTKVDNDNSFVWNLISRGGEFFYLENKYVTLDSAWQQFIVLNPDGKIGFYTDLVNHYAQYLKIRNI